MARKTLLLALLLAGCAREPEKGPYLGRWDAEFQVDLAQSRGEIRPLSRYGLKGYLMLYAGRQGFRLNLEGEQVTLDVTGSWRVERNARGEARVVLKTTEVKIDDQGGEEARNPNQAYVPGEAIRELYGRELVLRPQDGRLEGLPVTMGTLVGVHRMKRV